MIYNICAQLRKYMQISVAEFNQISLLDLSDSVGVMVDDCQHSVPDHLHQGVSCKQLFFIRMQTHLLFRFVYYVLKWKLQDFIILLVTE